jgi:biotin synthase
MRTAVQTRDSHRGRLVATRAVVEISSYCVRSCLYCGMRRENSDLVRYRDSQSDVLRAARDAASLGIKRIMLQAGDDTQYRVRELATIVTRLRSEHEVEVLLCLGDRPRLFYRELHAAGATVAILKFETANPMLFRALRPGRELSDRLRLLGSLRSMGFEISSGFIAGLPGESLRDRHAALGLVSSLDLSAASVSPFIPHDRTPLCGAKAGKLVDCLEAIAAMRLARPGLRIAAVSALNLVVPDGRRTLRGQILGLLAGADGLTINMRDSSRIEQFPIYTTNRILVTKHDAQRAAEAAGMRLDVVPNTTRSAHRELPLAMAP